MLMTRQLGGGGTESLKWCPKVVHAHSVSKNAYTRRIKKKVQSPGGSERILTKCKDIHKATARSVKDGRGSPSIYLLANRCWLLHFITDEAPPTPLDNTNPKRLIQMAFEQ